MGRLVMSYPWIARACFLLREVHYRIAHAKTACDFLLQRVRIAHARTIGERLTEQPKTEIAIKEIRVSRLGHAMLAQFALEQYKRKDSRRYSPHTPSGCQVSAANPNDASPDRAE